MREGRTGGVNVRLTPDWLDWSADNPVGLFLAVSPIPPPFTHSVLSQVRPCQSAIPSFFPNFHFFHLSLLLFSAPICATGCGGCRPEFDQCVQWWIVHLFPTAWSIHQFLRTFLSNHLRALILKFDLICILLRKSLKELMDNSILEEISLWCWRNWNETNGGHNSGRIQWELATLLVPIIRRSLFKMCRFKAEKIGRIQIYGTVYLSFIPASYTNCLGQFPMFWMLQKL